MRNIVELTRRYKELVENNPHKNNIHKLVELYLKQDLVDQAYETLKKITDNNFKTQLRSYDNKKNVDQKTNYLLAQIFEKKGQHQKAYNLTDKFIGQHKLNLKMLKFYFDLCRKLEKNQELYLTAKEILFIDPKDSAALEIINNNDDFSKDNQDNQDYADWEYFDTTKIINKNLIKLYDQFADQDSASEIKQTFKTTLSLVDNDSLPEVAQVEQKRREQPHTKKILFLHKLKNKMQADKKYNS